MRSFFRCYRETYIAWPLATAFGTCFVKGSIADVITQTRFESPTRFPGNRNVPKQVQPELPDSLQHSQTSSANNKNKSLLARRRELEVSKTLNKPDADETSSSWHLFGVDWLRNWRFATYSGLYTGCVQHMIYNVIYPHFVPQTALPFALMKSVFDALVHAPLLYFPFYYAMKSLFLGESPWEGVEKYWYKEMWTVLPAYWKVWFPVMVCVFWFIPFELRVGTVGAFSLLWLSILSYLAPMVKDDDTRKQTSVTSEDAHDKDIMHTQDENVADQE